MIAQADLTSCVLIIDKPLWSGRLEDDVAQIKVPRESLKTAQVVTPGAFRHPLENYSLDDIQQIQTLAELLQFVSAQRMRALLRAPAHTPETLWRQMLWYQARNIVSGSKPTTLEIAWAQDHWNTILDGSQAFATADVPDHLYEARDVLLNDGHVLADLLRRPMHRYFFLQAAAYIREAIKLEDLITPRFVMELLDMAYGDVSPRNITWRQRYDLDSFRIEVVDQEVVLHVTRPYSHFWLSEVFYETWNTMNEIVRPLDFGIEIIED